MDNFFDLKSNNKDKKKDYLQKLHQEKEALKRNK